MDGRPFAFVAAGLFVIVLLRAQGTYWLGRAASAGATRLRGRDWLSGERMERAVAALHRWGLPVIPLSFLTIGFQTVVNGAAGLTRMPWPRYTLAMIPGCVAWALIYAVALDAVIALAQRSSLAAVAVLVLVALVVTLVRRRRVRTRRDDAGPDDLRTGEAGPDR